MNYCKDCRWGEKVERLPYCLRPNKPTWKVEDPVKGIRAEPLEFCMHQRNDYSWMETCGLEGKWWEERPEPAVKAFMRRLSFWKP